MTSGNSTAGGDEQDAAAAGQDASAGAEPQELAEAFVIPRALAQATLDYLATQPYREVFALVRAFEALEPLPGQPVAQRSGAPPKRERE